MFGSKINPSGAAADLGDAIANSIRLNDGDSPYLTYTPATSPTDSQKTWTVSVWLKRCTLSTNQYIFSAQNAANNNLFRCYFDTSDQLHIYTETSGGATGKTIKPSMRFRDTHGWYHIVINWDTSQATASDRRRIYVNGVEITAYDTDEARSQNDENTWNATEAHLIGAVKGPSNHADMYIAKFEHFANQRLAATSFGRFSTTHTNSWVPITTTASFGTNDVDVQLLFGTAPGTGAGAGDDTSGNANDWTDNGLTADDQSSDTPTNVFPTFSSINNSSLTTLSEGSLKAVGSGTEVSGVWSTMPVSSGQVVYLEGTWGSTSAWGYFGVTSKQNHDEVTTTFNSDASTHIFQLTPTASNRGIASAGSALFTGKTAWTSTDTFQIAIDIDNGKLWFGVNDTWYDSGGTTTGNPAAGANPTVTFTAGTPMFVVAQSGAASSIHVNFGQDSTNVSTGNADANGYGDFEFAPPSGFIAFCQANLPNVVTDLGGVDKPSESVQLITASGDNIVSDLDAALASGSFLKIYKNITTGSTAWKWVFPDDTGNMWDSSVNTGKTTYSAPSGSDTFAGIAIKIDTSVGTASSEVSHTSGSSTNYAHGLGVTPAFVILFPNLTANKRVFHSALDSGKLIRLDNQQAQATDSSFTVDATNVTISSSLATGDYRILAFAEIDGFSSFKFHNSNSSADGPVLRHGFSPLFEITVDIDLTDSSLDWDLFSYKLESHSGNVLDQKISLNEQDAKAASGASGVIDHVSTGSKTRTSSSEYNTSSRHHARVAFAHAAVGGGIPFPNAR